MLNLARAFLERKGLGDSRRESDLLVAHALGLDRLGLYMRLDQPILGEEVDRARDLLVRRGRREPTAYIVGRREFFCRDFLVGPGVLVPRPETELIVDLARAFAAARSASSSAEPAIDSAETASVAAQPASVASQPGGAADEAQPLRILDIGTGSGCLAITLSLEIQNAEVTAVDLSEEALVWASKNAVALEAEVQFVQGDGFELASELAQSSGRFDLIVSNPPYVEPNERECLDPEVREHEPPLALYAPANDPDFWVRGLVEQAADALLPGGALLVELGHRQAERLRDLSGAGSQIHDDLAGIPRVFEFRLGSEPGR